MTTIQAVRVKAAASAREVPATVIGAIVAILLIGAALAFAAMYGSGHGEDSTPVVTFLTGILAPTLIALVALLKVERSAKVGKETNELVKAAQDPLTAPDGPTEPDPTVTVAP